MASHDNKATFVLLFCKCQMQSPKSVFQKPLVEVENGLGAAENWILAASLIFAAKGFSSLISSQTFSFFLCGCLFLREEDGDFLTHFPAFNLPSWTSAWETHCFGG